MNAAASGSGRVVTAGPVSWETTYSSGVSLMLLAMGIGLTLVMLLLTVRTVESLWVVFRDWGNRPAHPLIDAIASRIRRDTAPTQAATVQTKLSRARNHYPDGAEYTRADLPKVEPAKRKQDAGQASQATLKEGAS